MAVTTLYATGGWQSWTVPLGITQVHLTIRGGGSGSRGGGLVGGTLPCNPGDVLWFSIGKHGKAANGRQGGGTAFGGGAAGGDGHGTGDGGNGGGGATYVRLNSRTGSLLAIAAGAGGDSGDSGEGGRGGDETGEDGRPGNAGTGKVFNAQGGSQKDPGNGGSSTGGKTYAGVDAKGATGGRGGSVNKANSHGGGGGGGGYFGGGGGQASAVQDNPGGSTTRRFPGGGGGAGSNFVVERLVGATSQRGAGGTGDGEVTLQWSDNPYINVPPLVPTDVQVNGVDESAEMATSSMGAVEISALIDDANIGQKISLGLYLYRTTTAGNDILDTVLFTSPVEQALDDRGQNSEPRRRSIQLQGLWLNTLYRGKLCTFDENMQMSANKDPVTGDYVPAFNSISFWTNRPPNPATLTGPFENATIPAGTDVEFEWDFTDPDGGNTQGSAELRWRVARTPGRVPGPWSYAPRVGSEQTLTVTAENFRGNTQYEWEVLPADPQGLSATAWSRPRSFYVTADVTSPLLLSPIGDTAVEVGSTGVLAWQFRDLNSDRTQAKADVRYRVAGTDAWIVLYGDLSFPGGFGGWPIASIDLAPYQRYEWEARTYTDLGDASDWSETGYFRSIPVVGSKLPSPVVSQVRAKAPLGSGINYAFIYDRGGEVYRGQIKDPESIRWGRRRDDVGSARVVVRDFDDETLALLSVVESWQHELVIFRHNGSELERVFEGPITYVSDEFDGFEIQALDVMGYLMRRVIHQGYNDAYQIIDGVQVGLRTVVERAGLLVKSALAYDDPNLLPYLTLLSNDSDARESRVVPDYSMSVYDEVDSMAANAGLDYVAVGRRIVIWDTHQPIGRLPEMGNSDFLTTPRLTQFGMQAATFYAVTDGSGIAGIATRGGIDGVSPTHGALEMVASAYGATEGVSADPDAMTAAEIAALEQTFAEQAERNIAHRWPVPWEVRVPQNARLSPEASFGINQLVPGVWIPVRAKSRIRAVAQWQKIDQVDVEQDSGGERVTVIMNPAPNGGLDRDGDIAAEE